MATFIETGALARKTHRPVAIFLSRPLYLYEHCRRLLQSSHEMLLEAPLLPDDSIRTVDVLTWTAVNTDTVVQPAEPQTDISSDSDHTDDTSASEQDLFAVSGEPEDPSLKPEPSGTVQPAAEDGEPSGAVRPAAGDGEPSSAANLTNQADHNTDNIEPIPDDEQASKSRP